MNRSNRVDEVRGLAERRAKQSLRILRMAMNAGKDAKTVEEDARKSFSEAPFYLHAALRMGAAMAKTEDGGGRGPTNLAIVITGQAPSTAAWLEAAKDADVIHVATTEAKK